MNTTITYEASYIHFSSLHFYLLYLLLNSCDRNDGKPATWKQRIKPVYRRRYEGRRSSKPKLQWKQKIIIKYSEKRIKYRGKEFLHPSMWLWNRDSEITTWQHPAMWYVALRWHAIEFAQVPPYWNSTPGFDFDHVTAVDMSFCTSFRHFIQIGPPSAETKWRHVDFQDGGSQPSWILGIQ